ncbi:Leucine Rich repeats (2 copies) [Caulifigura coniformis]|uniref:Leucine Rich repeats (2 copies) n=1 Tax=Caulifigura coniformis TaxID=2527983 RepID=A0A517SL28_9PLAN|nr:hypothetical protein [Caulifigura coniformis]QDT56825.1 Leucine Rich repeats (2 copies) [Caulifigura coniformis]
MNAIPQNRRALSAEVWPGAAICVFGLLLSGCKPAETAKPAPQSTAAETPAMSAAPAEMPPATAESVKPTAPAEAPPSTPVIPQATPAAMPPAVESSAEKPADEGAPKASTRPEHIVALEKLGAVLDYGVGDRLIDVDLDGKPATDADLDHLSMLSDLKILNLSGSRITDAGLAKLAPLKRLKFLYLFKTDITDAGLEHLKELPRLEVLCLDQTLITDGGVKSLEALSRLEKLHVHSRVALTDASIDSLSKHVRLFELKVGGPGFTEPGIARLREALPNCTVHYDPNAEASEG